MNNRIRQIKETEKELLDKLVSLSYYNNVNSKNAVKKLFSSEVEKLLEEEKKLRATSVDELKNTGFRKTIIALMRERFETILERIEQSGEQIAQVNEQLAIVRERIREYEMGTENRSLIDGSGPKPTGSAGNVRSKRHG